VYLFLLQIRHVYTIGSAFVVAIQWYIACLVWTKIASDIIKQSFGDFVRITEQTQLSCNAIG
jgi:hypothetical protein